MDGDILLPLSSERYIRSVHLPTSVHFFLIKNRKMKHLNPVFVHINYDERATCPNTLTLFLYT